MIAIAAVIATTDKMGRLNAPPIAAHIPEMRIRQMGTDQPIVHLLANRIRR